MKKFIWIPITIVSLSSCSYPSFYEAKYSCNEWKKKGELYSGIIKALEENNQRVQDNNYLSYTNVASEEIMRALYADFR